MKITGQTHLIVYCHICGKAYLKHRRLTKGRRAGRVRSKISITCSKRCAHIYSLSLKHSPLLIRKLLEQRRRQYA